MDCCIRVTAVTTKPVRQVSTSVGRCQPSKGQASAPRTASPAPPGSIHPILPTTRACAPPWTCRAVSTSAMVLPTDSGWIGGGDRLFRRLRLTAEANAARSCSRTMYSVGAGGGVGGARTRNRRRRGTQPSRYCMQVGGSLGRGAMGMADPQGPPPLAYWRNRKVV